MGKRELSITEPRKVVFLNLKYLNFSLSYSITISVVTSLSLLFQLSLFFPSKLMRYLRNVKYAILNAQAALHHSCRPSFVTKDRTVKCDNDKNGLHSGFYIANQRIVLLGKLNTKIHFGTKSPNQVI